MRVRLRRAWPAACALALLLLAPGPEGSAGAGVFDPETFTLKNGMAVVVIPNHRVPVVTHMVWYKVGSADEPPGKSGIAHFLEHLMFKGTRKLASGEFSRILARNGGRENAFTSHDYTGYYQSIAVDRLEMVMEMEADRMTNLVFDAKEVEPERQVIFEERRNRTGNNPSALLAEHVNATLYLNHPYRRPIIGWEHEIRGLTIADLMSFYRRWYVPNNAILVVAGDITAEELRPLAEKTYGRIPAAPARLRVRPGEPPHRAARRVTLKDPRVRQPSWSRTFLAPSYTEGATEHVYALQVLAEILGGATGPLYRSLVVEQKLAVSAGAYFEPDRLGPGTFGFYASPRPGVSMEKLEAAMEAELARVVDKGVTGKEARRAKGRLQAEAVYARDSLGTGARVLGGALAIGLTVEDVESWPERIGAVTVPEINAAARDVLGQAASVTALLLPADKG
ncbi:MAG: insulinase family protein [Proteobacteria bacterium]|nr:insulinase family protein [Pseudomonadota bacterium]